MLSKYSLTGLLQRIRSTASTSSDKTKHILLLSSVRPGSGNAATAARIAHELRTTTKFTVDCVSVDAPQTECDSLLTSIRRYSAVLALHVYHAGNLLTSIYNDQQTDLPPLILIFAGTELHSCESKWLPTLEYIIPYASGLICFSHEWKKHVEITYGNSLPCKITVIPQSVLLSSFNFEQLPLITNKKAILWVGEIRSVKDPLFVIRVLSQLNYDEYHLFLVGYENDPSLSEHIRSLYSQPNLTFLGGQSQSFVHTLMRTAFAYINTSINEGMCLAILEAMTLGVPVLARRNIGNTSIIKHGKTGLIFDTHEEAVQRLNELDGNTKLRHTVIRQAENYVRKNHNIIHETKAYRSLLLDLIK